MHLSDAVKGDGDYALIFDKEGDLLNTSFRVKKTGCCDQELTELTQFTLNPNLFYTSHSSLITHTHTACSHSHLSS